MARAELDAIPHSERPFRPHIVEFEHPKGLGFSTYYPGRYMTNEDLTRDGKLISRGRSGEQRTLGPDDILSKVGVERRWVASAHEDVGFMTAQVGLPLVRKSTSPVDGVFVTTSYPTGLHLATAFAELAGLPTDAKKLHDVHAACSGGVYALTYMLDHESQFKGNTVLLLSSERYQPTLAHAVDGETDPSLSETIFSDGATGMRFTYGKSLTPVAYKNIRPEEFEDQSRNRAICMPIDASLNREADPRLFVPVPPPEDNKFYMDGTEVYKSMGELVPNLITDAIKFAGNPDIAQVIMHQASKPMVQKISKELVQRSPNLDGKVYFNVSEGNWSSGSTIKGLAACMESGIVNPGDFVVMAGFGAGFFASVCVVQVG